MPAWSPAAAERPWTVGIEEEVLLLDPRDWSAVDAIDDVLAALEPDVAAETHACVAELRTAPHASAGAAAADLGRLRAALEGALRHPRGLRAAAAGTHPLLVGGAVVTSSGERYREVEATMRALAHREPTLAQHVHVAVPTPHAAVRALDGLRSALPLLLALSANSPFWRGADSGFASIRTPIFAMFPRTGIARHFGHYGQYVRTVEQLLDSGLIPDPGFVWWDARLQPRLRASRRPLVGASGGARREPLRRRARRDGRRDRRRSHPQAPADARRRRGAAGRVRAVRGRARVPGRAGRGGRARRRSGRRASAPSRHGARP
jgi:glutamate---cysteine ligase / carboxylate-amine ligase